MSGPLDASVMASTEQSVNTVRDLNERMDTS